MRCFLWWPSLSHALFIHMKKTCWFWKLPMILLPRLSPILFFLLNCDLIVNNFPWKFIWKCKVSPRVAFFVWEVSSDGIWVIGNLRRRGCIIVNWFLFVFMERISLLMVPGGRMLWDMVSSLSGIQWVVNGYVLAEFLALGGTKCCQEQELHHPYLSISRFSRISNF